MRPYLAVIADSFRSALSSRILWVAFFAIWLFLGALAPIGYREDYTTSFSPFDFDNGTQLKIMLARGLLVPQEKDSALGRIAAQIPADLKRDLEGVGKNEVRIYTHRLADALNEVMKQEGWYDAEAWRKTPRLLELRELDQQPDEELSQSLRLRRARLRIEAALPGVFQARSVRSITLSYAGFDFPAVFTVGKAQFVQLTNQIVMPLLMNWLLGFVLIFLGILVTASIIPEMLQPGSLHLLLSKPISRTLLLLSKFLGGCAFVFLCVCQLVIGLWLIAGWRLDIWNIRLLWCIPVAVFLFAVFYSVSMLAGLRWRSPVLAIGATCIFGALVLVIGIVGDYFDTLVSWPDRIRSVAVAGDSMITATRGGALKRFDRDANQWQEIIEGGTGRGDFIIAPTHLDADLIVTARIRRGRFNPYGSGPPNLLLLSRERDWQPEPSLKLPSATRQLFSLGGQSMLAMNTGGLMMTERAKIVDFAGLSTPESSLIANLMRMSGAEAHDFKSILPKGVAIVQPARVVVESDGKSLILFTRGRLLRLQPAESAAVPWQIAAERNIAGDAEKTIVLAQSGSRILLARGAEPILLLDSDTFKTDRQLPNSDSIVAAAGLGDRERFVVTTSDAVCHLIDAESAGGGRRLPLQEVETVTYDPHSDALVVAHHTDEVDVYKAGSFELVEQIRPRLVSWRMVERYVITPLRTVTPQTGELGEAVAALVGGDATIAINRDSQSEGDTIRLKILRPVLSCAGFIVVMLSLSCVYFARKDF